MTQILSSLAPTRVNSTVLAIRDLRVSFGVMSSPSIHSGQEFPSVITVPGAKPFITFRTPFAAAYTLIGMKSLQVTNLDVFLSTFASTFGKSAASDHQELALTASALGIATITGLSVSRGGILFADVRIDYLSSNGTAHPITRTVNNAMITLAAQPTLHTIGPVVIDTVSYDGLTDFSIDLGQKVVVEEPCDGGSYPTIACYIGGEPTISISHDDPITLGGILTTAGLSPATSMILYAKQFSATTGAIVGGATAVSITAALTRIHPLETAANQDEVAKMSAQAIPFNDGTGTHPLAVSLSATAP